VAQHRGPGCHFQVGYLGQANLLSPSKRYQRAFDLIHAAAEIAHIPDVDRVALRTFDGGSDVFTAYRIADNRLRIIDRQAVSSKLMAFEVHVQEVTAFGSLRENVASSIKLRQQRLNLFADLLDHRRVSPADLDSHWRADPRCLHVDSSFNRHRPTVRDPGD